MSIQSSRYIEARMSQRALSASEWNNLNPCLEDGEIGIEDDTKLVKIGDGHTNWQDLDYLYGIDINYRAGNGIIISNSRTIQAKLLYDVIESR